MRRERLRDWSHGQTKPKRCSDNTRWRNWCQYPIYSATNVVERLGSTVPGRSGVRNSNCASSKSCYARG